MTTRMYDPQFVQVDRSESRLQKVREAGRNRFRALAFPNDHSEDWRFTSVAGLLKEEFALAESVTVEPSRLPAPCAPSALRLVYANGIFDRGLSKLDGPAGVVVGSLTERADHATRLGTIADASDHVFTALNTSLVHDGALIVIPDGLALETPIEIVFVVDGQGKKISTQPRTLIVVGKNAQVGVVERYVNVGGADDVYFTNAVTEIALAESAIVDHVKVQQESQRAYHLANTQVVLAGRSTFTSHYLSIGGGLVRNETRVRFDGELAEATINGLYLGSGSQHIDSHTVIDHAKPNCASHEIYKGILNDQAHGVFNGKIFVRPDAQKTDAKQTNKVLLLSDSATINTKPQLEIFADDVKCTHGATVGQLDDDQVYYLQSRGIPRDEAHQILTFAFANDIVSRVALESIRDEMEAILIRR